MAIQPRKYRIIGRIITYLSWIGCWMIFTIKLDFIMWLGTLLFALGLSGLLIWDLIPLVIKIESHKKT